MKEHPDYSNLLQFDNLNEQRCIQHFCTTRNGGVSEGSFSSLNLGNYSDDSSTNIFENKKILSHMWYMDVSDFIIPHQTHSSKVILIDDEFMNASQADMIEALYGYDASITHLKNIFLCATTADCVPVLLYDKAKQVISAIHAGWKGIVGGIIESTISTMKEVYQSNPNDIIAAIGPSISLKNYEVGDELITKFKEAGIDLSSSSYVNEQTNKWHINLKQVTRDELVKLGIPLEQIETSNLCTYDETDLFFSARRQSIICGRMLSGIKLVD